MHGALRESNGAPIVAKDERELLGVAHIVEVTALNVTDSGRRKQTPVLGLCLLDSGDIKS